MRPNFIGNLGSAVQGARPAAAGAALPRPRCASLRGPLGAQLLCLLAGACLAVLLPLVPGFLYREVLPGAVYSLLVAGAREPRVTHVSVRAPACAGVAGAAAGGPRVHLMITVQGLASKLALTLPSNMRALGSALGTVYLLAAPEDDAVLRVAAAAAAAAAGAEVGVEAFQSRIFTHRGALLNVAGAKRWLQEQATAACARAGRLRSGYLLSLDVDILLPHDFGARAVPALAALEAQAAAAGLPLGATLYSMPRQFFASPADAASGATAACPPPSRGGCEAFLGYFQLFSMATNATFEPWSKDAALLDIVFRDQFANKTLLPGVAAHLGRAGLDWTGLFTSDDPSWRSTAVSGYTSQPQRQ